MDKLCTKTYKGIDSSHKRLGSRGRYLDCYDYSSLRSRLGLWSKRSIRFKLGDISYFYPNLNANEYRNDDIYEIVSKIYYKSIHLFLDSARDYAYINLAIET